jgi:hypothetical protein
MKGVPTTAMCPICKEQGEQARLFREIIGDGVFCNEGHNWPSMEDASSYSPLLEQAPVPQEEAEAAPLPPQQVEVKAALKPSNSVLAIEPPPMLEAKKATPPTVARALEKLKNGQKPTVQFSEVEPVELPGGDMLVTLRISGTYVGAIKQEAENQNLTVQDHLQNIFSWGIESGWFC